MSLAFLGCLVALNPAQTAKWEAVPFTAVTIQDRFLAPRQSVNQRVTVLHLFKMLKENSRIRNLELAAAGARTGYKGLIFDDSDTYKVLEAASYVLALKRDPVVEKELDDVIAIMAKAQMPDGYLNSYYQINSPDKRWTNLRDNHELYCAGHLFEAAAAHYTATGKRTLLDIAVKFADHIDARFGPGKKMGYPGHPEIELALVRLADATGNKKYFELSRFFVESRGRQYFAAEHNTPLSQFHGDYWQDNAPIRDHNEIVGHAVRAAYLFCGVTDIARVTGDKGMVDMLDRVWDNTVNKRMFITGGLGPSGTNEGFTVDYDLPTDTAYQETCASIANALWNHRMGLLHGDGKHFDVMETALYNGLLSGGSWSGDLFFYSNPLASAGNRHRTPWFECACCPPNWSRMVGSLGQYAYATDPGGLSVILYAQGQVEANGAKLSVKSDYPWNGEVKVTFDKAPTSPFTLRLRKPNWAKNAQIMVNGKSIKQDANRGFWNLRRTWKKGDIVNLTLDLPIRKVVANPEAKAVAGMFTLARGPLIYCLEGADNNFDLTALTVRVESPTKPVWKKDSFGGIMAIEGEGLQVKEQEWDNTLYQDVATMKRVTITAIPYGYWNNRKAGQMRVWLSPTPPPQILRGLERTARPGASYVSRISVPAGMSDGYIPASSNPNSPQQMHWWDHLGTKEWASYTWNQPVNVKKVRVYWFDDTGRGACRIPESWNLEYLDGDVWKPVVTRDTFGLKLDAWNEVSFLPVKTTSLRLNVSMQKGFAAGIHEWQVF